MKYWDIDCYESDHKPVYGIYKMQVKKEDLKEKKRLIELYMVS